MEHVSRSVLPFVNTDSANQASDMGIGGNFIPTLMQPGIKQAAPESILSEVSRLKRSADIIYFAQYMIRFAMSAASFGLAVAATVLSGGAGIPIAAVTGAALLIAAGDACCAFYNMIQARNDREPLQTGNDCIVLTVKKLMQNCCPDHSAELVGDVASFVIRATVSLSSVLLPQFLPSAHLSGSTAELLSDISVGFTSFLTVIGGLLDTHSAYIERRQRNMVEATNSNGQNAQTQTDDSVVSDEMIQDMVSQVVACYERYRLEHHEFQASTA
ncbi:hypothetical protein EYY94_00745 [Obesumbacterium proteus]|uniref:hypothetical protein n=1 Tax=Obesumbacterium proteus TaxID=82983 RepID=UPI001033C007|nr:hypothetical protein [Obesumbacterium proteus]TBL79312.1 hypothetical protein EYY94_00745 [Obesumbacterium proteus]